MRAISEPDPFMRFSYILLAALGLASLAMPFSWPVAFLPVLFLCGWCQIGGL